VPQAARPLPRLEPARPSLESIFLALTGRNLRDS
jgi:hypothetical protein